MLAVFLETLPFFGIIALGFLAGRTGFFTREATAWLTRFVFYFALSAMLFRFAARLSLREVVDPALIAAYVTGTGTVYAGLILLARLRGAPLDVSAMEAQAGVVGNVGFLGVPMLALLLGPGAAAPVMQVLSVDLILFGSLVVVLVNAARGRGSAGAVLRAMAGGLLRNPMIVSIAAGLGWSALALPLPGPLARFLEILGGGATPGALFAIGASLGHARVRGLALALWLAAAKLVLHPAAVALTGLWILRVQPEAARAMIAAAALPTAGNVYILAQHYRIHPERVSAVILVSTLLAVVTLPLWLALTG